MLTVGEILREERERQGISITTVEKHTKVRAKYIAALEANDWRFFPSKIYIIGVIRNYSKLLNLDVDRLLAFFRRDYEKHEDIRFKRRLSGRYLTSQTRKFAMFLVGLAFLFFFAYFGYQLTLYFSPPDLEIISPESNFVKSAERITIVGKTQKEAEIRIFGERVFPDDTGRFEYVLPLEVGSNTFVVEVTGASGKTRQIQREYIRAR